MVMAMAAAGSRIFTIDTSSSIARRAPKSLARDGHVRCDLDHSCERLGAGHPWRNGRSPNSSAPGSLERVTTPIPAKVARPLKRAHAAGALRYRHVEEIIFPLTVPETEVVANDARLPAVTGSAPEIVRGAAPELAHSGIAHAASSDALETRATCLPDAHDHVVGPLHRRNLHGLY